MHTFSPRRLISSEYNHWFAICAAVTQTAHISNAKGILTVFATSPLLFINVPVLKIFEWIGLLRNTYILAESEVFELPVIDLAYIGSKTRKRI